ncbi:MAG TPA: hypothetical protein PLQ09_01785 [Prolixibacteraceae bacterium]|nr:hypothetical protein [Prolixibacteraceae bacterium]
MAKLPTNPVLFDEVMKLTINDLKRLGYLTGRQQGNILWTRNGEERGSISIYVHIYNEQPHIILNYKFRDQPREYKIYFTTVKSNLGKGEILYFICPETGFRCRTLYLLNGYFLHRKACTHGMYSGQTQSKAWGYAKYVDLLLKIDDLNELINKKHFKRKYYGKPTRRYLYLTRKINQIEYKLLCNNLNLL